MLQSLLALHRYKRSVEYSSLNSLFRHTDLLHLFYSGVSSISPSSGLFWCHHNTERWVLLTGARGAVPAQPLSVLPWSRVPQPACSPLGSQVPWPAHLPWSRVPQLCAPSHGPAVLQAGTHHYHCSTGTALTPSWPCPHGRALMTAPSRPPCCR